MAIFRPMDPAHRRYEIRTNIFMAVYVLVNVAVILGAFDAGIGQAARLILGIAVVLPIAGQLWATLALTNESDEFVRTITAKRFVMTAGLGMALFSA